LTQETSSLPDLDSFIAAMSLGAPETTLGNILNACPNLARTLRSINPVKAAATIGGLLLKKRLQPNCVRLETLVHACVALGGGTRAPMSAVLVQGYAEVGAVIGYMEDPPEDVFVGNIASKRGNYRVLEGIWETGTFYLQRIVNLADNLPADQNFAWIANAIHALLRLSEVCCERAGLSRNDLGSQAGEAVLPSDLANSSANLRQALRVNLNDLGKIGIEISDLDPFIFDPSARKELLNQSITNSTLEAHPVLVDGNELYLALPTAVSAAIRRFFIRILGSGENRPVLLRQLAGEYSKVLGESPLVRARGAQFPFSRQPWGTVCCFSQQVDQGRFLNVMFILDPLDGFEDDGLSGMYLGSDRLTEELRKVSHAMQTGAEQEAGFKSGITLVVMCGVGRGVAVEMPVEKRPRWDEEFLSAADFCTLGRFKGMEVLDFWRVLDMRSRLKTMNVQLHTINGFLNLYAWVDSLDGHLVPHAEIPEDFVSGRHLSLSITQNALLDLRHKAATDWDPHVAQFVDGRWLLIMKEGASYFEEDHKQPLYGHLPSERDGHPLGATSTAQRTWWYELGASSSGEDTGTYDRWKMVGTWLPLAVGCLERVFGKAIGPGPVLWRCVFEAPEESLRPEKNDGTGDLSTSIAICVDHQKRTIELTIGPGFDKAIFHPINIAERALVRSLVCGVAELAGSSQVPIDELVAEIVPSDSARHAHRFYAQDFRDHIQSLGHEEPIKLERLDAAAERLGIGWKARSPRDGGKIIGKEECQQFLNTLVGVLENDLCAELRQFDRTALLRMLLNNHEAAAASRDRWHRTSASILALRRDKQAAMQSMLKHEQRLNAIFQSSRNLMEIALCESPIVGGLVPGELDLTRLLARANELFHTGGWSDLIYWDCLEPTLIVRPLGDVHAKHDFMENVLDAFGNAAGEYRYTASAASYAKNLRQVEPMPDSTEKIDSRFLHAWRDDFGVDIGSFRRFLDAVEDLAIDRQLAVMTLRRSELIALGEDSEAGTKIVDFFTLRPREAWKILPEGFDHKDIATWRFRRRLSALRRPLFQLTLDADPKIIFAPGLLREGLASTIQNYYSASYPDRHLNSAMRRYAGYARQRDGAAFNREVAARMSELGWQIESEILVTKILGQSFERNYGDVDVLAWDCAKGRILVLECKDLQFRKTYGEIAEQLADYRGVSSSNGKDRDSLRRHLDRVEILRGHSAQLGKFVGMDGGYTIESVVVFRDPVPMQFASGPIRDHAKVLIFQNLSSL
jgi:hypothetical protein